MGRDTLNLGLIKNNANLGLIWEGMLKSGLILTINPKFNVLYGELLGS